MIVSRLDLLGVLDMVAPGLSKGSFIEQDNNV